MGESGILIADEHEVARSGVRAILEAQPNYQVVAEASNGKEAILKASRTKPDIAIVDYALPLVNGAEVTRQIRARSRKTEVPILTMHATEAAINESLKAGARGYVVKTDARQHILAAIEALAAHRPYFTPQISEVLLESFVKSLSGEQTVLTRRERGVVQLIAEGHTNKEIAKLLGISLKTVETHRAAIMHKLHVSSLAALVRFAVRNKVVEP